MSTGTEPDRRTQAAISIPRRVASYSAPFVSLWEDLQDEIIARTEHVA